MERGDYERLRWRCIRRALLELDIVLTRFLENGFENLTDAEKEAFVDMADMEDHDLWSLINGQAKPKDLRFVQLAAKIRGNQAGPGVSQSPARCVQ